MRRQVAAEADVGSGMGSLERGLTALVLAVLVTALSGCEMSPVAPDAEITITGTVLGSDDRPVTDAPVVLLTEPTFGDVVFGLPLGLGSLGLLCLADDPPPPCDTRHRGHTGDEGGFSFTVTGRETQGMLGDAARMTVSAAAPPLGREVAGPAVTGAFVVRAQQVELEPLTTARADLTLSAADGHAQVAWAWQGSTLRGGASTPELVFEQGGRAMWVAAADGSGVDLRILEQQDGSVNVVEHRRAEGTVDDLTYRSEVLPYVSGAGAPPSRGTGCSVVGADDTLVAVAPCPFTDGNLVEAVDATLDCDQAACRDATGYVIDLGSALDAELLVVRGCAGTCPVEVSGDGADWQHVGEVTGPYVTLPHDGQSVQFVRISGDAGVHGLAEVSVWDGPADQGRFELPPVSTTNAGGEDADDGSTSADGGDGTDGGGVADGWLAWLAATLLVASAIGVGIAIGRRSRGGG